jgi:hypothetical protein
MSKLLSMLIASLFAAGAAVAQGTGADYGKAPSNGTSYNSNSPSGKPQHPALPDTAANDKDQGSTAYGKPQHPALPNTAANDKDKAASGTQYPPQQQMGANPDPYPRDQHMADRKDKAAKPCPPGLAKKNNGCMPPRQANKHDDTRVMGNKARERDDRDQHARDDRDRDRDHRRQGRDRDQDRSGSNSGRH